MTNPIDTIRKTLLGDVPATEWDHFRDDAVAALTELEQQLAAREANERHLTNLHDHRAKGERDWQARAVAAETALAEKDTECADWYGKALAAQHDQEQAERRAKNLEEDRQRDRETTRMAVDKALLIAAQRDALADALREATVRNGVCLVCGSGVTASGIHIAAYPCLVSAALDRQEQR